MISLTAKWYGVDRAISVGRVAQPSWWFAWQRMLCDTVPRYGFISISDCWASLLTEPLLLIQHWFLSHSCSDINMTDWRLDLQKLPGTWFEAQACTGKWKRRNRKTGTESWNGKLKRKAETETLKLGNGRQHFLRYVYSSRMRDPFGPAWQEIPWPDLGLMVSGNDRQKLSWLTSSSTSPRITIV
jgi:hypothetical protein